LQQPSEALPAQAVNQAQGDPQGKLVMLVNQGFLTTSSRYTGRLVFITSA
jgi:hypothetical protein